MDRSDPGSRSEPGSRPYYPITLDERADPGDLGWDTARFESFVQWCEEAGTNQLLILDRGRLVAERYWNGAEAGRPTDVYSIQKSVVSTVIGSLIGDGLLDLEQPLDRWLTPVGGDRTAGAPPERREAVRLRHVLTMTTGLYDDFTYEADPGSGWYYNNNAYHQLRKIVAEVDGRSADEVFSARLFDRIGMEDSDWRPRADATDPAGAPLCGLFASGRDLARFGLLALGHGVIDEGGRPVDVIGNQPYFEQAMSASQNVNPSYGLLWWIHDGQRAIVPDPTHGVGPLLSFGRRPVDHRLAPSAPPGTVGAMGAADQRLFVVPGHDVVVVRLGRPVDRVTAAAGNFDEAVWKRLAPALPAR